MWCILASSIYYYSVTMKIHFGYVLMFVFLSSGCAVGNDGPQPPQRLLRIKTLTLAMARGVNADWPVEVGLARVEDETLVQPLLAIEAMAWFGEAGRKFRQSHPQARFDSWEVVPGTVIGPVDVQAAGDWAGVLFCGLRSMAVPLRVEQDGNVTVRIEDAGCLLEGGGRSKESSWLRRFLKRIGKESKAIGRNLLGQ